MRRAECSTKDGMIDQLDPKDRKTSDTGIWTKIFKTRNELKKITA
jgi:hypothetical protein